MPHADDTPEVFAHKMRAIMEALRENRSLARPMGAEAEIDKIQNPAKVAFEGMPRSVTFW